MSSKLKTKLLNLIWSKRYIKQMIPGKNDWPQLLTYNPRQGNRALRSLFWNIYRTPVLFSALLRLLDFGLFLLCSMETLVLFSWGGPSRVSACRTTAKTKIIGTGYPVKIKQKGENPNPVAFQSYCFPMPATGFLPGVCHSWLYFQICWP